MSVEASAFGVRCTRWLAFALAGSALIAALTIALLMRQGETRSRALRATAVGQVMTLAVPTDIDSLRPMVAARAAARSGRDLYAVFFEDKIKFQYPPSALLVLDVLPDRLSETPYDALYDSPLSRTMRAASIAAVLATIIVSVWILHTAAGTWLPGSTTSWRTWVLIAALGGACGLFYYPLLKGHSLGQVQVFLNAALTLALLSYLRGRSALAGSLVGLCCLFKPHYAVFVFWAAIRRDRRFAVALTFTAGVGLLLALGRYGLRAHLDYVKVLSELSRHGEVFWANQSINGFLHRWLGTGDPMQWNADGFAPFYPFIYVATVVSSLVILGLGLWGRSLDQRTTDPIGYATMLAAVTIAAPIAWDHHYGAFLGIFAVALPRLICTRPLGRATGPVALLGFVAMSAVVLRPAIFFTGGPALGAAASHLLFGALLWFAILLLMRSRGPEASGVPAARP